MHEGACPSIHNPHIAAGDLQKPVIHCVGAAQRLQRHTQCFSCAVTCIPSSCNVSTCLVYWEPFLCSHRCIGCQLSPRTYSTVHERRRR